ncbi:MAG: lipopolysaccharide biosynthesis protein [Prevotella sp.]|nr:lipopolysaccharide biosynthesis protein [Prevotella sp.]
MNEEGHKSTLKEKTAKGLFWGALNSGATQIISLLLGIFLARRLTPDDYGIVGVLAIFIAIAGNLQSSGFTQGLVNMKQPTQRDYNAVFWFNTLASLTIYVVLFLAAPLIADYFHQPALVRLSRFIFLTFFISSFGIAPSAYLYKNMMNRENAINAIVASLLSGAIGLILAYSGYGYWSLAWQQVSYVSITVVGRYYFSRFCPQLHFDFSPIRRMFSFSVKILLTNIVNTVSTNVLTFIFGRLYAINQVGNFYQAFKWDSMAFNTVSGAVAQVAQPVMVDIRDDDEREVRVFRKLVRATSLFAFPAMFGLSLVADEFIHATIGEKWADCVPLLQVLCISGAFMPFYTLYQNLTISKGRSGLYFWCNTLLIVLQIALVAVFHEAGMQWIVVGYSVLTVLWLVVWQLVARRLIGLRFTDIMKDMLPFCFIAAAVMAVSWLATSWIEGYVWLLLSRAVIAATLYYLVLKLLHVKILQECEQFLLQRFSSRGAH